MSETPKQKAIREAYGEYFDQAKPNKDGWCDYRDINSDIFHGLKMNVFSSFCENTVRPRSLEGIENNHGWLSVKEHGLPKEDIGYYHICVRGVQKEGIFFWAKTLEIFTCRNSGTYANSCLITHYQPVVKPKPPIY